MAHRWHDVFHAALIRSEVVGVKAAVRAYLRREPTQAELSAARRAVDSFARAEPADVYQVPVNGRRMLLLARPGVEVDAAVAQRAVTRPIRPSRPRKPDPGRLVEMIERGIETAAAAARQIDPDGLDRATAADVVEAIREPLAQLDQFMEQLQCRTSTQDH